MASENNQPQKPVIKRQTKLFNNENQPVAQDKPYIMIETETASAISSHQRGMIWEAYLHSLLSKMFPPEQFLQLPTYCNVTTHPLKRELVSEPESLKLISRVEWQQLQRTRIFFDGFVKELVTQQKYILEMKTTLRAIKLKDIMYLYYFPNHKLVFLLREPRLHTDELDAKFKAKITSMVERINAVLKSEKHRLESEQLLARLQLKTPDDLGIVDSDALLVSYQAMVLDLLKILQQEHQHPAVMFDDNWLDTHAVSVTQIKMAIEVLAYFNHRSDAERLKPEVLETIQAVLQLTDHPVRDAIYFLVAQGIIQELYQPRDSAKYYIPVWLSPLKVEDDIWWDKSKIKKRLKNIKYIELHQNRLPEHLINKITPFEIHLLEIIADLFKEKNIWPSTPEICKMYNKIYQNVETRIIRNSIRDKLITIGLLYEARKKAGVTFFALKSPNLEDVPDIVIEKETEIELKILKAIEYSNKAISTKELKNKTNINQSTLEAVLKRLVDNNRCYIQFKLFPKGTKRINANFYKVYPKNNDFKPKTEILDFTYLEYQIYSILKEENMKGKIELSGREIETILKFERYALSPKISGMVDKKRIYTKTKLIQRNKNGKAIVKYFYSINPNYPLSPPTTTVEHGKDLINFETSVFKMLEKQLNDSCEKIGIDPSLTVTDISSIWKTSNKTSIQDVINKDKRIFLYKKSTSKHWALIKPISKIFIFFPVMDLNIIQVIGKAKSSIGIPTNLLVNKTKLSPTNISIRTKKLHSENFTTSIKKKNKKYYKLTKKGNLIFGILKIIKTNTLNSLLTNNELKQKINKFELKIFPD